MASKDLKDRTKNFSLRVVNLVKAMPSNKVTDVIGRQLLRSGTSVGANYRSACRSRTQADFLSRMAITQEEADESQYWLELLADGNIIQRERIADLIQEANELVAILTASIKTAKLRPNSAASTYSKAPSTSKPNIHPSANAPKGQ